METAIQHRNKLRLDSFFQSHMKIGRFHVAFHFVDRGQCGHRFCSKFVREFVNQKKARFTFLRHFLRTKKFFYDIGYQKRAMWIPTNLRVQKGLKGQNLTAKTFSEVSWTGTRLPNRYRRSSHVRVGSSRSPGQRRRHTERKEAVQGATGNPRKHLPCTTPLPTIMRPLYHCCSVPGGHESKNPTMWLWQRCWHLHLFDWANEELYCTTVSWGYSTSWDLFPVLLL